MSVQQFLAWAIGQENGRYELVRGQVVAMAPERARHNLVKLATARALGDAVARSGLPCTEFTDGMTVIIDDETAREPDAAVQCGVRTDLESTVLEAPLIVVEVASPSSARDDTGDKLVEYFSVPSIRHYLIVRPEQNVVIHHARSDGGDIVTRIVATGDIDLVPPGMSIPIEQILGRP
jgi:Uma2 family endonuclease